MPLLGPRSRPQPSPMDPELLAKLLAQSPLIAIVIGLLFAIKMLRGEHQEREKVWKQTLDLLIAKNDSLQDENLIVLKENIKIQTAVETRLSALERILTAGKGG